MAKRADVAITSGGSPDAGNKSEPLSQVFLSDDWLELVSEELSILTLNPPPLSHSSYPTITTTLTPPTLSLFLSGLWFASDGRTLSLIYIPLLHFVQRILKRESLRE